MAQTMSGNDVLVDILEDNRRRLERVYGRIGDDCLHWRPDAEANSIAVTSWHMARLMDVFLARQIGGQPAERECWFRNGWVQRTGYDPQGLGHQGWGSLNGYTAEEVVAIPQFGKEHLLGYLDEVYGAFRAYVQAKSMDELQKPAAGFEGRYTRYHCLQMALLDNVRHLGEIMAIAAMWARRRKASETPDADFLGGRHAG